MSKYQISNTISGALMGTFEGETKEAALDAMAREAGYEDYAAAMKVAPAQWGEIIVKELREVEEAEEGMQSTITDAEAKQMLAGLFAQGFGISGHHVSNGADYYRCSACWATKDTMGHANGNGEIDDVDHREGCELVKLHQWATSKN